MGRFPYPRFDADHEKLPQEEVAVLAKHRSVDRLCGTPDSGEHRRHELCAHRFDESGHS